MQKLDYQQAQNLNSALNYTEVVDGNAKQILKSGKHLSGESFLNVMGVKKKLRDLFEDMQTKEKELFQDNNYVIIGTSWTPPVIDEKDKEAVKKQREDHKELSKKLDRLHNEVSIEIPEPFLRKEEFLEWTKECGNEAASILAEFLLKDFEK